MRKSQDLWVSTDITEFIEILGNKSWHTVKKNYRAKTEYIDTTCTLDIETTNSADDGFAYSFAVNVGGENAGFRYIEDFIECVNRLATEFMLDGNRRLVFYIHNAGYEHMYLTQILHEAWILKDKLLTKARKPLYLRFDNGVEFRDSLKLFQKSLARATKGCPHEKMVGDLDYTRYRTPDTPLAPDEWNYIVNDVQGLYEAIERLKAEHGYNQATIPFTNTGMVIEEVNRHVRKDIKCLRAMQELQLDKQMMHLAYKAMAGGDTHGTRWRSGVTYLNCNSADLKSAHPSQQALKKFPSGKPFLLDADTPVEDLELLMDSGYGWIGRLFISNFRCRPECPNPTLSSSKCEDIEGSLGKDNGRVMGAKGAICYMDSNDWQRFREAYEYEDMIGIEVMAFRLEYLPEAFTDAIKEKFIMKESAPDGPDRVFAKICVNTIFGACAQKVIRDEYTIDSLTDSLFASRLKWEDNLEGKSEEDVKKAQKNKFPFLWGLWTASLSRLALWNLIKTVGWENAIYWDTDSVKYEGEKVPEIDTVFNRKNHELVIDRGWEVKNRKGKAVFIGSAEDEHPDVTFGYRKFRFLHAKCYAAESYNGTEYELETTLAGVGKREGVLALAGDIDRLDYGLFIADAGGQALTYHDAPVRVRKDFKRETMSASWVVMEPRQYEIKASPDTLENIELEVISG